jgi:molecular chaperone GrpE
VSRGRSHAPEEEPAEPSVRIVDRRRVDPETGEPRPDAPAPANASNFKKDGGSADSNQVAELTADLQRITAEYANYRKRVERDRDSMKEQQIAQLAMRLLPALDDIERAREHGDLNGAFATVADQLLSALRGLGLETYGEVNDPFDPNLHEALQVRNDLTAATPTVVEVVQPGYRIGERVVRPTRVVVAQPESANEAELESVVAPK